MKYILLGVVAFLFLITLSSAQVQQDLRQVEQGSCINLEQQCNCTMSNITKIIYMKNSTVVLNTPVVMTKNGIDFNYTYCSTDNLGIYKVNGVSDPDGVANYPWSYTYEVTPNGYTQTTSQGITSSIMFIGLLVIGFSCLLFGFKLIDNETMWFFGVFVIFLGVGMLMYSMTFSFIYLRDVAYTSGTSSLQEKAMRTFFRGVQVIGLFFLPIAFYYGYNVWKGKKKQKEMNDGWDDDDY